MSTADNHGQRFIKGRGSYARPALENRGGFPLLSARLSALARRFAAIVAVLAMVGAFVAGGAPPGPPKGNRNGTRFSLFTQVTPNEPLFFLPMGPETNWVAGAVGVAP